MIRSALLLIRTSLPSVLVLAGAVLTLSNVMSAEPGDEADAGVASMPSLAPLARGATPTGNAAAALRVALFDPERRPETLSGSIDDLRVGPTAPPVVSDVAISGVMVGGGRRRAMLAVAGGHSIWSDVGAEVGGWHVAAVDAGGALLERDGQTLALTIADRLKNRSKPHSDAASSPGAEAPPGSDAPPPASPGSPDPLVPPDPTGASRP